MSVHLPSGRRIALRQPNFGAGAEGLVYAVEGTDDLCAKIYFDQTVQGRAERMAALRRATPASWAGDNLEHLHVAWPVEVLNSGGGEPVGFLMPFVRAKSLTALFDPRQRIDALEDPTWRVLVAVAARVARLLAMLHGAGIVIGDVSPANILVSRTGHITLIDCDAVQFTDQRTGTGYPCSKVTPEYAPSMSTRRSGDALTPEHDNFGLAILVCQLLMEGEHPFEGVLADPQAPDFTSPENIRHQHNRVLFPERFIPVAGAVPPAVLPPAVHTLARACFGDGHRDPSARPTAQQWADALDTAGFQLMGCRASDRHLYHRSLSECVWCDLARAGMGDHYPPSGAVPISVPAPAMASSSNGLPPLPLPPPPPDSRAKPVAAPAGKPATAVASPGPPIRPPAASSSGGPNMAVIFGFLVIIVIVVMIVAL